MATIFDNVALDSKFFGLGSSVSLHHATSIISIAKGVEQRVPLLGTPSRRYELRRNLEPADYYELQVFALARRGSLRAFKIVDPVDKTTASDHLSAHSATDVRIGTGDGTTATFQMCKRYGAGTAYETTRTISQIGAISVAVNGTTKTETTHYTVDYETGIVTFTGGNIPATGEGVTAGCSFYVPVRFDEETDNWLGLNHTAFSQAGAAPGLVEEKVTAAGEEYPMAGTTAASLFTGAGAAQVEFRHGTYLLFAVSASINVYLPDIGATSATNDVQTHGDLGGWAFHIHNQATGAYTLTVHAKDAATGVYGSIGTVTRYQSGLASAVTGEWLLHAL